MNKKNIILFIVLLILVLSAYFYSVPYQNKKTADNQVSNFLQAVRIDYLDQIILSRKNQNTVLIKDGDRWKIEGAGEFYVDKELADRVMDTLVQLASSSLSVASIDSVSKPTFQADKQSGLYVTLVRNNEEQVGFIMGKSENGLSYISQENDPKTYLSMVDLSEILNKNDWRDTAIFNDNLLDLNHFEIKNFKDEKKSFVINKKDNTWFDKSGKIKLNNDKVSPLINLLADLVATSIPEQNMVTAGLVKPTIVVIASGPNIKNTLMLGADKAGDYFIKQADSPNIYLLKK